MVEPETQLMPTVISEQLRPREAGQVAADEDRALYLAHEHGGGGGQRGRAAQAHGLLEHEAEALGDPAQDPPVPQQGRQRADHEDHRQHPEGEHEQRRRVGQGIRLVRRAGQEAEHEADAGLGAVGQPIHRLPHGRQPGPQRRQSEQRHHQQALDDHRPDRQLPGEAAALLRHRPAQGDGQRHAHQALGVFKTEHGWPPGAASESGGLTAERGARSGRGARQR
jgi:hypothetical protein